MYVCIYIYTYIIYIYMHITLLICLYRCVVTSALHLCNYVSLSFHFSSSFGGRGAEARPQGVKPDEGEGGGQRGVIRVIGFGGLGFSEGSLGL